MEIIIKETYGNIIKDLGGSISQNRLLFQRLWAISKIYELYETEDDFVVLFDFACDVDVLTNNDIHFYQIKTSKSNKFTLNKLIKVEKTKKTLNNHSILSRLGTLENYEKVKSLNIVSNIELSEKEKSGKVLQVVCLGNLSDDKRKELELHIESINKATPNLFKYFYIKSDLSLDSSDKMLLGSTVIFLEKKFETIETRASYFLDWLMRETESKSSYEYDTKNIEDAIKNKGITKQQFEEMLETYDSTRNEIIQSVRKFIDINYNLYESSSLLFALKELTRTHLDSINNENILKQIRNYILINKESFLSMKIDEKEIVKNIIKNIEFPKNYNEFEKECLSIVGLLQFKKGIK